MKAHLTFASSFVRRAALGACLVGALSAGGLTAASAATNVSLNVASYNYSVFDSAGNAISALPQSLGGDQVGYDYPDWANYDVSFWTATTTFNASSAGSLTITDLEADDATVVKLNGVIVAAAGIYGPGNGLFVFSPNGPAVSQFFLNNGDISTTTPLVVNGVLSGSNTLEILVNNNFTGIYDNCGSTATDGLCGYNPTHVGFSAVSGVPEPTTWAMLLLGFFGIGFMMRGARRKDAVAVA